MVQNIRISDLNRSSASNKGFLSTAGSDVEVAASEVEVAASAVDPAVFAASDMVVDVEVAASDVLAASVEEVAASVGMFAAVQVSAESGDDSFLSDSLIFVLHIRPIMGR